MMGSEMQLNARRRDGTEFPVEVGLAPVEIGGKRMVTAIVTDISARVAAEERIRELNAALEKKLNELTAANQELAAFSYSVSHDLRAPLRSIDGFSQALLEDYADKLDDPGREHLTRVRAATQRMGHLIDDLLKLSRVTRAEMRPIAVDLSALASDVFAELRKSKPDRRVECHIEPGLAAEGDARLLRVAIENLLGNAWKFTGKTANAKIEFGATRDADGASSYFVRDNGAGFDMVYADKLFGAFQRLHSMDEFPGTGIGLATVQRIVHRHGGQVRAEGVPGQGATFHFTLTTGRGNRS
jgi:light-regulated signal transduction histidine kinase (bacteriophytochrome)